MPLPAVGFFAWLLGLVTSSFTSLATWLVARFAYEKAVQYALITAFLVAAATLMITLSLAVKAAIFGLQVAMPNSLGLATYFLPGNINQIFAYIVTLRTSRFLYRWTVSTMSAYLPHEPKHGLML